MRIVQFNEFMVKFHLSNNLFTDVRPAASTAENRISDQYFAGCVSGDAWQGCAISFQRILHWGAKEISFPDTVTTMSSGALAALNFRNCISARVAAEYGLYTLNRGTGNAVFSDWCGDLSSVLYSIIR